MNIKMTLTFWIVGMAFAIVGALLMYGMAQNFLIERYIHIQRSIIISAWQTAIPGDEFPTQDQLISIGHRVVRNELAAGGVLYNEIGMKQDSFGVEPVLGYDSVRLDPGAIRWSPTGQYYDFSLPQALLGTNAFLIVRISAAPLVQQAKAEARKLASALISMGTGVAGLLGLFFFLRFVQPLGRIIQSIIRGVRSPTVADSYRLNWRRNDLIGELSRTTDHLLSTIGVLHQEELTVMQRAIDAMPFAVLQFDQNGTACNANGHALIFLQLDSLAELSSLEPKFILDRNSRKLRTLSVIDLLAGGDKVTTIAPIHIEGRSRDCLITASTVRSLNGEFLRYVMLVVDLEEYQLKGEKQATDAEREIESRRVFVTSEMIRCCDLALQANIEVDGTGRHDSADFAADWFSRAQKHHVVGNALDQGVIPLLVGAESSLREVMESAMLLCVMRSVSDKPNISVTAHTTGVDGGSDGVRHTDITIRERLRPDARPAVWVHDEDRRWKMAVAALTRLLPQLQGKGLEFRQTKTGAVVEFSLPCDTSSRKKTAFELESESA